MISVSVIIVNYNARYFLKNCIGSILCSDIVDEIEIIVIDNNSSDGSPEMLSEEYPEITCLQNKENIGFSKANNRGVAVAKGNYVLILNPDTMLAETTLSQILNFSEQQAAFGASGVQFIDGSGKFLPESKRNFPSLRIAGAKLLGYSKDYYANHIKKDETAEAEILTGAFMFIKRKVYEEVGGFDEDFFMYGEDIDLSYRIRQAGYRNFYAGGIKVLHFKGESTVKDRSYLKNFYGALSIFFKKHYPHNALFYSMIDVFINLLISVKSLTVSRESGRAEKVRSWVYVGDNSTVYRELEAKCSQVQRTRMDGISNEIQHYELVFLDSSSLSFEEIIRAIGNLALGKVKKRIVSKDGTFYLGSDTSDERGDVQLLIPAS